MIAVEVSSDPNIDRCYESFRLLALTSRALQGLFQRFAMATEMMIEGTDGADMAMVYGAAVDCIQTLEYAHGESGNVDTAVRSDWVLQSACPQPLMSPGEGGGSY